MSRSLKRLGWTTALWRYLRDGEASIFGKLLAVFAVLYVVMPVDLIPDVPLIGWLDDLGVVALVGAWLTKRIAEYRAPDEVGLRPRRPFSVMP
ncbi:MAG: DUF1232 domain-containing protein [Labilithrix sp.]|nr:DUF1232 domain-containing protein [Labilithrix sp.]MCW5809580.1 DUF1232 domain-containing protein [Labilithrix sp.]